MHFDRVHFHTRTNMSASAVCHQFRAPAGAGRIRRAANRSARAAKVRTASERTRHVSRPDRSASRAPGDPHLLDAGQPMRDAKDPPPPDASAREPSRGASGRSTRHRLTQLG